MANAELNTVTPIDLATGMAGAAIPTGGTDPSFIAVAPDGNTVYVVNRGMSDATPIYVATNVAGTPIPVGGTPTDIAITPDGTTAYVTDNLRPR